MDSTTDLMIIKRYQYFVEGQQLEDRGPRPTLRAKLNKYPFLFLMDLIPKTLVQHIYQVHFGRCYFALTMTDGSFQMI